ncbi:MAG TPA: SH3 domain-containing protein [Candidatus Acidoferrales bacterium]|nr:SH3 domain-containing protein [Candidatus Acidoferrales bacterium]
MRNRTLIVLALFVAAGASSRADTVGYGLCGTYDAYLLLYRSTAKFDELGKLRCGEKVEILSRADGYAHVRTIDGRLGWIREGDLTDAPPPPQREFTFGLSEPPNPEPPARESPRAEPPANQPPRRDVQPVPVLGIPNPALTNEDVMLMRGARHDADFIIAKIKSGRCAFDTSAQAIQKLRASGVPDRIILAMMEAPVVTPISAASAPKSAGVIEVKVPDGTAIDVELAGDVSPQKLEDGTVVEMSAAEDLVVDGVPIVLRGSAARARVMAVRQPGTHGGTGEVAWFMQDIVTTSGERIPVTFAAKQPGNNRTRNFEGYPFFLTEFQKGSPAIKAADNHFRAVVHGDTLLRISQSLAANLPATQAKPQTKPQSLQTVADHPLTAQPVSERAAVTPPVSDNQISDQPAATQSVSQQPVGDHAAAPPEPAGPQSTGDTSAKP